MPEFPLVRKRNPIVAKTKEDARSHVAPPPTLDDPRDEALKATLRRGFHLVWAVARAYAIRDEMVVSLGESETVYPPMLSQELPSEMSKLVSGDKEALLQFVNTYGLFGYATLTPSSASAGEPLAWIRAHAQTLKLCLDVSWYLQGDDATRQEHQIDAYLHHYHSPMSRKEQQVYQADVAYRGRIVSQRWVRGPGQKAVGVARALRRKLVNANIQRIRRELHAVNGRDRSFWTIKTPVEGAYWHVAEMISGNVPVVRCKECGTPFIQTDARQRFCPASWRQAASPCAIRKRVRDHRRRQQAAPRKQRRRKKSENNA